jgi:hypothetical protein
VQFLRKALGLGKERLIERDAGLGDGVLTHA